MRHQRTTSALRPHSDDSLVHAVAAITSESQMLGLSYGTFVSPLYMAMALVNYNKKGFASLADNDQRRIFIFWKSISKVSQLPWEPPFYSQSEETITMSTKEITPGPATPAVIDKTVEKDSRDSSLAGTNDGERGLTGDAQEQKPCRDAESEPAYPSGWEVALTMACILSAILLMSLVI